MSRAYGGGGLFSTCAACYDKLPLMSIDNKWGRALECKLTGEL